MREVLWLLLAEVEEKAALLRRLPPLLRLTLGRFEGTVARDRGGGAGGGTRDWYGYTLKAVEDDVTCHQISFDILIQ